MDWTPYRPCCHRNATDAEAGFCPECGHAFLRCMAFAECRSLVTPTDACPVCVAPLLMIDAGAVVQSKTGDRVSVPLILHNGSPAARPIWVKRIVKWDGRVEEPLALTWEQIEPGAERTFTLDTPPLAEGGTHTMRLLLVIASRYKGLEEEYAFAARTTITVSGRDPQNVTQHLNFTGAVFQTGGLVNTHLNTRPEAGPEARPRPIARGWRWSVPRGTSWSRASAATARSTCACRAMSSSPSAVSRPRTGRTTARRCCPEGASRADATHARPSAAPT